MLKNVAGIWFESKTAEDEYVVRTYDLGNGHREAVISRPVIWQEVPPELAARLGDDWRAMADRDAADKVKQEEKREANLRRCTSCNDSRSSCCQGARARFFVDAHLSRQHD